MICFSKNLLGAFRHLPREQFEYPWKPPQIIVFACCFYTVFTKGKGPKIKKRKSMVFDPTPPTPSPLTLTMEFLLRIFKICTENVQINTIKNWSE